MFRHIYRLTQFLLRAVFGAGFRSRNDMPHIALLHQHGAMPGDARISRHEGRRAHFTAEILPRRTCRRLRRAGRHLCAARKAGDKA